MSTPKTEPKPKTGRPSKYTPELGKEICDAISTSTIGLKKLCGQNPHWPNKDTIYEWIKVHSTFSDLYATARRCQAEVNAECLNEVAEDIPTFIDDKGIERVDSGILGKYKLLADIKKWQAAKLAPKIYGDRTHQTVEVKDEEENARLKKELLEIREKLAGKNIKEY